MGKQIDKGLFLDPWTSEIVHESSMENVMISDKSVEERGNSRPSVGGESATLDRGENPGLMAARVIDKPRRILVLAEKIVPTEKGKPWVVKIRLNLNCVRNIPWRRDPLFMFQLGPLFYVETEYRKSYCFCGGAQSSCSRRY